MSAGNSTYTGRRINFENQQLTEELHKPIIIRFKKRKVSFKDNVRGADVADIKLLNKYDKRI